MGKKFKTKKLQPFFQGSYLYRQNSRCLLKMMKRITKCRLFLPLRITEAVDACGWKKANKLIP